jgi:hypothetical protein
MTPIGSGTLANGNVADNKTQALSQTTNSFRVGPDPLII